MRRITLLDALMILGTVISAYLAYVHYFPGYLACFQSAIIDCAAVITSVYSTVFGVPLAIYAFAWFVGAFLLARFLRKSTITGIWFLIGIGGIFYSFFSMYMLGKICVYCLSLDVIITISIFLLFGRKY